MLWCCSFCNTRDVFQLHLFHTNCNRKDRVYLVSNGDVGAFPAVLPCCLHTVLTDGFVGDGNSLRQLSVFQNDLRRQRLFKTRGIIQSL